MPIEEIRGCGYRKVGGTYLISGTIFRDCDRLPYHIKSCPVCGEGLKFTRGLRKIDPFLMFGHHLPCKDTECQMCDPTYTVGWLMGVGEKFYTPESFMREAARMGMSKRINNVPKDFVMGQYVYVTHHNAMPISPLEGIFKPEEKLGIFAVFRPERIELLIRKSEATEEYLSSLAKRNITPVIIPDGDPDHDPDYNKK